jgi:ion channel-forming bestrophin family protein
VAFAEALKHKLRFEPYTHYEDLAGLVGHLNTFAKEATTPEVQVKKRPSQMKAIGQMLGVSFAESNPRKTIKRSTKPLGNLPLEILSHLSAYIDEVVDNGTMKVPMHMVLTCKFNSTGCWLERSELMSSNKTTTSRVSTT